MSFIKNFSKLLHSWKKFHSIKYIDDTKIIGTVIIIPQKKKRNRPRERSGAIE